jgi:hypothetical protein
MLSPAVFGITDDGLNLAVNLLLLFLFVLWLALVYWTYADARRRVSDPMLVGCATVAALFPFVGTIVYMVVRPPEYLEDVHERELEIAAAEARLATAQHESCPYCEYPVERSYLRCPACTRRLKEPCQTCGKPLDPRWRLCPYCEAEAPARERQPARGRSQRRRPATPPKESNDNPNEKENSGPDPDPRQARRVRARTDRGGDRPVRAQGPEDRGAQADDGGAGGG